MGIVVRQSFWVSFITYFGVVIGYLSTLVFLPKFLTIEEIGLVRLIQSNALLLIPLTSLGLPNTIIKLFPRLEGKVEIGEFIVALVAFVTLANLCIVGIVMVFFGKLEAVFTVNSSEYIKYIYASFIILFSQSVYEIFASYLRANLNIVIPNYFKEIHLRLCVLTLVILYGIGLFNFDVLAFLLSICYLSTTMIAVIVTYLKRPFAVTFRPLVVFKKWKKDFLDFGVFAFILGIGGSVSANLGFLLIATFLGLEANGIFTTSVFIATLVDMPKRASSQIISPFYSSFFHSGDFEGVKRIYSRSAVNLYIISTLIAIGILTNLTDLYALIPKGQSFAEGYYVIVLVVIGKVLNMGFGTSGELLVYSDFKRYQLYVAVMSAVLTVVLSYALIPIFGILGAGMTLLLVGLFGAVARAIVIWIKLRMSPFSREYLKVTVIFAGTYVVSTLFSPALHPALNIIIRAGLTIALFVPLIYFFKASSEVNSTLDAQIAKIRVFLKGKI